MIAMRNRKPASVQDLLRDMNRRYPAPPKPLLLLRALTNLLSTVPALHAKARTQEERKR